MLKRVVNIASLFLLTMVVAGCSTEFELATLLGKWSSTKASFAFNLVPIHKDDLNLQMEFLSDGTLMVQTSSGIVRGTYKMDDKRLLINDIVIPDVPMNFSGNYDVKSLTETKLILYGERQSVYTDPAIGTVSGMVKATFSLQRAVN